MYQLSRDYDALFDLLLNGQRVACFVDNKCSESPRTTRDICLAKRSGHFRVQVSVRGVSYFSIYPFEAKEEGANERKLFAEGCAEINLEWIVPSQAQPWGSSQAVGTISQYPAATDGLPMDCFRCCSCGKVWKRCHGKPEFCEAGGFWLPGAITIKEVQPRLRRSERVAGLPGVSA